MSPSRCSTSEAAPLELRLDDVRDRRLARAREAREPEDEAAHETSARRHVCNPAFGLAPCRPSVPARPLPGASSACRRSSRSRWSWSGLYGSPRSRMYAQQSSSVQSASGFAFQSSCCVVPAELRRVGARRRLVAADPGDPAVEVEERPVERLDLRDREIEVGLRLPEPVLDRLAGEDLDRRVVARLDRAARARTSRGRGGACRSRRRAPSARAAKSMSRRTVSSFWNEHASATRPGNCSSANATTRSAVQRLDVRRQLQRRRQGAPPSACRRAGRAAASRAG